VARARLSAWRVRLGFLAGAAVLVLAAPTRLSIAMGLGLAAAGEALRVWASGHIEKTRTLATGGPYARTQNPLYLGSLLLALGVVVASASLWVGLLVGGYILAFYPAVMREEAAFLAAAFPEAHAEWVRSVPRFLPRLWPGGPARSRFRWGRVRMTLEWRTCLAIPALFALLYLRGLWR
jgi:protein-S-isoprenylcysteine O-methyltransferase Ste14